MKIERKVYAIILTAILTVVVFAGIGYGTIIISDTNGIVDDTFGVSMFTSPYNWIVTTDNLTGYWGINGSTGKTVYGSSTFSGGADNVIQSCYNALPRTGGIVYIKAGTYWVDHAVEMYRNTTASWNDATIQGSGMSTAIRVKTGTNCNVFNFTVTGSNNDGFKTLRDMEVYGYSAGTSGHGFYAKHISGAGAPYDIALEHVFFTACAGDGIHIEDGWGVQVTNCLSEYNSGYGMYFIGSQMQIINFYDSYNTLDGMYVSSSHEVTGSNVQLWMNHGNGLYLASSNRCSFENLIVNQWGNTAAGTYAAVRLESSSNNTFTNMQLNGYGEANAWVGLYIRTNSNNNTFSNVDIKNCATYVIDFKSGTLTYDNRVTGIWLGTVYQPNQYRNILNGVSYNTGIPGNAGVWKAAVKEGVFVWDTSVSKLYVYCNSTWHTIANSTDTVFSQIICSNGNYYTATAANLQTAINSLSNTTGSVYIPTVITITTPIKVGRGCTLYSNGLGGLTQGNANNKTLLTNYDNTSALNNNITLKGLYFNQNGLNQAEADDAHPEHIKNCIYFARTRDVRIEDCKINNTQGAGILLCLCNNSIIQGNTLTHIGSPFVGTGKAANHVCGIYFVSCLHGTAKNNIINDVYANGVTTEKWSSIAANIKSQFISIEGNVISDCSYGIYPERSTNISIDNNVIDNCKKVEAYGAGLNGGILFGAASLVSSVNDSTISGNLVSNCGTAATSTGIQVNGFHDAISNNHVSQQTGSALYTGFGDKITMTGNQIDTTSSSAIYIENVDTCAVTDNVVYGAGSYGLVQTDSVPGSVKAITISGNTFASTRGIRVNGWRITISGNTINATSTYYPIWLNIGKYCSVSGNTIDGTPVVGIALASGSSNCSITGNTIANTSDAAIKLTVSANCTISSNVFSRCYYPIQESGACNSNQMFLNVVSKCTDSTITLVGNLSWSMRVNATSGKIGVQTSAGTTWH